ncbi:MAG: lamin tail domain-containing protein, partial [Verrucomicrobiales bacterium]
MIIPALGQLQMSEVMTCNERILHDEEGKSPDWIELFCSGEASVDLQDFGLRQAVDDKVWQFPAHVLEPGERLVVFASGKTMWEEGECHVPFRL